MSTGLESNDLFEYDPGANKWTNFKDIILGQQPTSRSAHGFTGGNGKIYLFGGLSELGKHIRIHTTS
jgi:hypothetical protein